MTKTATQVRKETISLPMARLGAPSNLPRFQWQQPMANPPTPPNFGLSAEEAANGFNWGDDSILPYQVFEDYDREREAGELECLVLENDKLRAIIAPSLGGRLLALEDVTSGRDLVFRNPVFQPANLAALNAWFSGGVEWNGLIPGHTPFTCAPVFAGIKHTERGPILRIYEFDRIAEATWQVDLHMPNDTACLYAHGRIVNPDTHEKLVYWWTNVAAPMSEKTRVLSPADYSIEHIWPGNNLGRCAFPNEKFDGSYPRNWENSTSVFFRAPNAERLFITSVDGDGKGLIQTATSEMKGRKFFYFGNSQGGQNWMDYLSEPGEGNYLEIQSGIAPTQNQRFVLGANEVLEWTEAYAPIALDPEAAHDADYGKSVSHARTVLDETVPLSALSDADAFLREQARLPLDEIVCVGAPWGQRHERLLGRKLAEGLDFLVPSKPDFWDMVASNLPLDSEILCALPDGVVTSKAWVAKLLEHEAQHGSSWLHALMLGIACLDQGEPEGAAQHIRQSLALSPSWAGYRMLAVLGGDTDEITQNYLKAWAEHSAPPALAIEIANHFMKSGLSKDLKQFVSGLPESVRGIERIVLARAVVAGNHGDYDEVERLLFSRQFATIREGETLLSDLWVSVRRGRLTTELGREPHSHELRSDLATHPLPVALDLRMHVLDELPA